MTGTQWSCYEGTRPRPAWHCFSITGSCSHDREASYLRSGLANSAWLTLLRPPRPLTRGRVHRGPDVDGCCQLLGAGILGSCSCPPRSGVLFSVNLRQDKCSSLFCNFVSPYEWKVTSLKVRHERRLSGIFQAVGNILRQKTHDSAQDTEHRY